MKVLAVLGDPIIHSKSPIMYNNVFKKLNIDAIYSRFCLKDKEVLKDLILKLKLYGANITLPFKEKALEIADFKDNLALKIGSANTLLVKENKIYAYNTDGIGFLRAIKSFEGIKSALILGAGGTARAISFVLKQNDIKVCIANRSKAKLEFFKDYENYLYDELKEFDFDIVINTTSAGLNDDNLPCDKVILKKICQNAKYAFDAIYGKNTHFLRFCQNEGLICKDGFEMLLWQGVYACKLFFGINDEELLASYMAEVL